MPEQNMTPEESLRLIERMIKKTRTDVSYQSPYFLMWGWATLIACVGQFVLKTVLDYRHHYIVWLITIPCAIITVMYSIRQQRKIGVSTYVSENMKMLWTGVGISFLIMSLLFIRVGWFNCYPFYMLLYGLGSFVSGRILRFTPFLVGGIISWILAAISIWFSFDYQNLFAAAAILFSYIIPGHLIRKLENPARQTT